YQLSLFSFAFHPSSVLPSNILIHLPGFSAPDADPMAAMSAANMQKFDLLIHNLLFWNPRSIVLGVSPVMLRVQNWRLWMRKSNFCILAALIAAMGSASGAEKPGKWIKMFDGKTLDGWKANENNESWSVKNGAIVGDGER